MFIGLNNAITGLTQDQLSKTINSLFSKNEQGVWYDPSDFSTMYQDAAGTTPVTAVEQPVGLILDKSKGLVLGPELVVNGDFSNGTPGWTLQSGWAVTGGQAVFTGGLSSTIYQSASIVTGKWYKVEFDVVATNGVGNIAAVLSGDTQSIVVSNSVGRKSLILARTGNANIGINGNPTASFTIDNISVRELPGNHAFQSTSASRPVLSARVNLLTYTEQFDNAAWVKGGVTITANTTTAPDGTTTADTFIPNSGQSGAVVSQSLYVAAAQHTFTFMAKAAGKSSVSLVSNLTGVWQSNIFNLSAQTVSPGIGWTASIAAHPAGNGWFICTCSATADVAAIKYFQIATGWIGDGTSGIYIWGADLRPTNAGVNLPPYQRVGASTDYDTAGFPAYLKFDGVDDFLVTNSIDFTSTDKMTVVAGVRKLTVSASSSPQTILELSTGFNFGSFSVTSDDNWAARFMFYTKGTLLAYVISTNYPIAITKIVTGIGDISGDSAILRVDGTQAASNTADQGTGNYGNYPLYIGRRGGTALPFNGHLYGLIVRGAQSTTAQIVSAETYVNNKTGAY